MTTTLRRSIAVALAAGAAIPVSALATNGYFSHGWGTESKAMAGVATALPQDTLVAATNPAGMAFVGNSLDVGIAFFHPSPRGYEANSDYSTQVQPLPPYGYQYVLPTGGFVTPGEYDSDSDWFVIPSFGYNQALDEQTTIGVSIYGNGGMNTNYKKRPPFENFALPPNTRVGAYPPPPAGPGGSGPYFVALVPQSQAPGGQPTPVTDEIPGTQNGNPNGMFTATTPTGISLEQLFIEVPYTFKFAGGNQAIAIAPVLAIQRFEAKGLQPFMQLSVDPSNVTNNGKEWSYGGGLHVGWYGEINEQLALGASYRTKMWMSKFDNYAGLFADEGSFDIPAMFNLGVAYKPQKDLTIAFDYQHIFYDEIGAIANSNDVDLSGCQGAGPKPSYCLGGKSGVGFGWDSMDVFKLGVKYDATEELTVLGGVSYNTDFLKTDKQGLFNVLAPATVRWHLTAGAAYKINETDEVKFALSWMPKETWDGSSPELTQNQTGSLYMEQWDIEVGYRRTF